MILVLFDIDGTLINTHGAGRRALNRAFFEVCGLEDGLGGFRLDGQTDLLILRHVLSCRAPGDLDPELADRILDSYLRFLDEELNSSAARYEILSGVCPLLERLAADDGFALGLATGNIEPGARRKLERGNLNRFFRFGGFGSDSESRTELIRKGVERGLALSARESFERIWVVGDTPTDVHHARAAGVSSFAVASGNFTFERLQASFPDLLERDLSNLDRVHRFLRDGAVP